MNRNPRPARAAKTSRQAERFLAKLVKKRADFHNRMVRAQRKNDEATVLVTSAMAIAYTDSQVLFEEMFGLSPRKSNTKANKRKQ